MESTVTSQLTIFLFSAVVGASLGILYDAFGILNAVLRENLKRIFVQDVMYFVISAIVTFVYMLVVNGGEIRVYIIVGEALGWLIYRATIGRFIYKIALKSVKFVMKIASDLKNYVISKLPKDKINKLRFAINNKIKRIKELVSVDIFWAKPHKNKKSNKNKVILK